MTEAAYRPYASSTAVMKVLRKLRQRNLPDGVTVRYIRALDVPDPMASRVLKALRFLRLVGEDGEIQQVLGTLARSTSDDAFRETLAGAIRQAYRDIILAADPLTSTQDDIKRAFGQYNPRSQHYRMTVLFLGLCRGAGIPTLRQLRLPQNSGDVESQAAGRGGGAKRKSPRRKIEMAPALESDVLWGFLIRLPAPGSVLSRREQEAWLEGMKGALHLEYPVDDEEPSSADRS